MKVERIIGQFRARGDDGVVYDVIEKQDFIDAGTKDSDDWLPGLKWTELPNGRKLNFIDETTFKIVSTGVIVHRID